MAEPWYPAWGGSRRVDLRPAVAVNALTELERRAWCILSSGPAAARAFYETVLDGKIVVLLADRLPIQERDLALTALCEAKWDACRFGEMNAGRLSSAVGFVGYDFTATKDGVPYSARVSSVYVRRDEGWKLVFHQHARW
ncbi:hypothetical protein [Amycolatopsis sp. TNS106]|uniref:hypothetical protein n=1 Tax=Amycolatopsis sp. TNS106 TaxID=2861750 RepID=UPI001C59D694|nr:hypothetical protein [Amycolatopsis sp. TNS106]QXV55749.1 hypothetical protein CVV72_01070 [Amycolatopsis sp. TNS106]